MDKVSGFWALLDALGNKPDEKRTRSTATYSGTDSDGTPWVTFPGSSEPTPVRGSVTSDLSMGDEVEVEVSNGRVSIVGNNTDPSLGTKAVARAIAPALEKAEQTERIAREATEGVAAAQTAVKAATDAATQAAANAQAAIDASDQHFFADGNGVHVSTEEDEPEGTRNILINSLGVILRKASTILAQFTEGEVAFYDGAGNAAGNVVAAFGASGAQIGKSGESHALLDYRSLKMVDADENEYFGVGDLRGSDGKATITEKFAGDGDADSFMLSVRAISSGFSATVEDSSGNDVTSNYSVTNMAVSARFSPELASGDVATVTYKTESTLAKSYTAGLRASGSFAAPMSFAEGNNVTASGAFSHAEGASTAASGRAAHAEGSTTEASGYGSHAEGYSTKAHGDYSHAEGQLTEASGKLSHAAGVGTLASSYCQTAIGEYNVEDANGEYALIIGNGSSEVARSNALTVDWDGKVACSYVDASGMGAYGMMSTPNTMTLTKSEQLVDHDAFIGRYCTHEDGGIKVANAGTYLVQGSMYLYESYGANDIVHAKVKVGNTVLVHSLLRLSLSAPYTIQHIQPTIAQLSAGDVVKLYAYNQTNARGTLRSAEGVGLQVIQLA